MIRIFGPSGLCHTCGYCAYHRRYDVLRVCRTCCVSCLQQALPLTVCHEQPPVGIWQAAIWREQNQICILLKSRKNLQGGSGVIRRDCTCPGAPKLCPVHRPWEGYLGDMAAGTRPWEGVSAAMVLWWTRDALRALAVSVNTITCSASSLACCLRFPVPVPMAFTPSGEEMPGYDS